MTIDNKPIIHGRDHMSGGVDPIPGMPTLGSSVEDIIKALPGLDAFWKLNEQSGTVAADSSGNNHDLQPGGGLTAPDWGDEVGPPGDTSAFFSTSGLDGLNDNAGAAMGAFTDDFTAAIWAKFSTVVPSVQECIGQGSGGHSSTGWTLGMIQDNAAVLIETDNIQGNNNLAADTWYFLTCVRDAGTFKLYVDGLLQSATMTTSFTGSAATWIGNDNFAGHSTFLKDGLLSYGFIVDGVLSGQQILDIYNAGFTGGFVASGKVWTSNGAGGASWQYPTLEVEY